MIQRDMSRYRFHLLDAMVRMGLLLIAFAAGVLLLGRVDETVVGSGSVDFQELAPVAAKVAGQVERVLVREGQRVKMGELLVELDADDAAQLATRLRGEIADLERRLEYGKSEMLKLQSEVHELALRKERRELRALDSQLALDGLLATSKTRLYEGGYADLVSAREARIAEEIARANRAAKRTTIKMASSSQEIELLQKAAALSEMTAAIAARQAQLFLAEKDVRNARVLSPIDGVVLTAYPERLVGKTFARGEPMLTVANVGAIDFLVMVDQRDVSKVQLGQSAIVYLQAFPFHAYRSFRGTVTLISSEPQDDGGRGRAAYRVKLALDEPVLELEVSGNVQPLWLRPGLRGEAQITVNSDVPLHVFLYRKLVRRLPTSWNLHASEQP